jgi:hypothetical protein
MDLGPLPTSIVSITVAAQDFSRPEKMQDSTIGITKILINTLELVVFLFTITLQDRIE